MSGFRDDDFFLDARRAPSVRRRPESFEREHHARLQFVRMVERYKAADNRLFPDREANAVAVLQGERRFFIWESEFLRLRPERRDLSGVATRPDQLDRSIEVFAAALVGVN